MLWRYWRKRGSKMEAYKLGRPEVRKILFRILSYLQSSSIALCYPTWHWSCDRLRTWLTKINRCNKFSRQHGYKRIQTLDITFGKHYLGKFRAVAFTGVFFCVSSGAAARREREGSGKVKRKIKGETRSVFALFAPQVQGYQIASLLQM